MPISQTAVPSCKTTQSGTRLLPTLLSGSLHKTVTFPRWPSGNSIVRCVRTLPCVTHRSPVLSRFSVRAIYVRKDIHLLKMASTFYFSSRSVVSKVQARAKSGRISSKLTPWHHGFHWYVHQTNRCLLEPRSYVCTFAVTCACFHLTIAMPHVLAVEFYIPRHDWSYRKSLLYLLKSVGVRRRGCSGLATDRHFASRP